MCSFAIVLICIVRNKSIEITPCYGLPKATRDPIGPCDIPVDANSIPFPIDGPPISIADPTLTRRLSIITVFFTICEPNVL
jgi:hypothetical protein